MDNQSETVQFENSNLNALDLENFDMQDFDMDTIDTSALMEESDFLNKIGEDMPDSDVAINFGNLDTDIVTSATVSTVNSAPKTIKIIKVSANRTDTLPFTMKDVSGSSTSSSQVGSYSSIRVSKRDGYSWISTSCTDL